jgi:hypothetical protein
MVAACQSGQPLFGGCHFPRPVRHLAGSYHNRIYHSTTCTLLHLSFFFFFSIFSLDTRDIASVGYFGQKEQQSQTFRTIARYDRPGTWSSRGHWIYNPQQILNWRLVLVDRGPNFSPLPISGNLLPHFQKAQLETSVAVDRTMLRTYEVVRKISSALLLFVLQNIV